MSLINNALERAVLSCLCQHGIDFYVNVDFLTSEYFAQNVNKIIFSCLKKTLESNQVVDFTSILSTAQSLNVYDIISGQTELSYIRSLFSFPADKENGVQFAGTLAKLYIARQIKKELKNCSDKIESITGDEKLEEILAIVENPIMDLTTSAYRHTNNNPKFVGEGIEDHIKCLEENEVDYLGIPTGMPRFDGVIGNGLRRKTVTLIASRTGMGKSVIATNVGLHVSNKLNIPALYLDTEMDLESQQNRMLANLSGVKINDLARGKFSNIISDREKVRRAGKILKNINMQHISVAGNSFDGILAIIKRWIYQHVGFDENGRTNDCLIIYDYFKLMSSAGLSAALQEYQALGFQITKMHDFCVEYDVPCLSFVQLNRDNEVAQSDRLQWLASVVAKFEPKSPDEIAEDGPENGNRKLVILKTRHGEGLEYGDYISVYMNGSTAYLEEKQTRNELNAEKPKKPRRGKKTKNESDSGPDIFDQESDS